MNYLGHLYFSKNDKELMLANLFGDFIKGKDYSYLPKIVQNGVALHREIDDFVDHHPSVTELRLSLYSELPRIAGIAIDLFFDHLLSLHWEEFHPTPLIQYVDDFFEFALHPHHLAYTEKHFKYSEDFIYLLEMMHKHQWIRNYKKIEGLDKSAKGLSERIAFPNNLGDASMVFMNNENYIKETFFHYMEDARKKFLR